VWSAPLSFRQTARRTLFFSDAFLSINQRRRDSSQSRKSATPSTPSEAALFFRFFYGDTASPRHTGLILIFLPFPRYKVHHFVPSRGSHFQALLFCCIPCAWVALSSRRPDIFSPFLLLCIDADFLRQFPGRRGLFSSLPRRARGSSLA